MAKECPTCGQSLSNLARFCSRCGRVLQGRDQPSKVVGAPTPGRTEAITVVKKPASGGLMLAAFATMVALFVLLAVHSKHSNVGDPSIIEIDGSPRPSQDLNHYYQGRR